jgi:hypothetical protein
MGVRTRGLDIKAGAAKLKADRAARLEAELVIDRWNGRLATGCDMLWSPTIRAALVAGTPWLDVFCPGCGTTQRFSWRPFRLKFEVFPSPPSARTAVPPPPSHFEAQVRKPSATRLRV